MVAALLQRSVVSAGITCGNHKRILACSLAVLGVVFVCTHWSSNTVANPQTLEGWHVQQPAGVPYLGANSRFTRTAATTASEVVKAAARAQVAAAVPAAAQSGAQTTSRTLGPTTNAPMKVLPPFEPTCIATQLSRMETWGCPVIMCNKDPTCSVHNTSCCAYLNYQMLSFLHDFLASKCLQDEYLVCTAAQGFLHFCIWTPHTILWAHPSECLTLSDPITTTLFSVLHTLGHRQLCCVTQLKT